MLYGQRILLTGGRAPAALHLARLLKKQACTLIVAETFEPNICSRSNQIDRHYLLPSPTFQPRRFIERLILIIQQEKIDWLIPCAEEGYHIALHAAVLKQHTQLFCFESHQLKQLYHKFHFNQYLLQLGLPAPTSFLIQNRGEAEHALAHLPEFILKPVFRRATSVINDSRYISDQRQWSSLKISPQQPWIMQEHLKGERFSSLSIVANGLLSAQACYPLQKRMATGQSTYFKACEIPALQEMTEQIIKDKGLKNGFLSFDFVRSERDQQYYCIASNPLLTNGIFLFSEYERIFDRSYGLSSPDPNQRRMLAIALFLFNLPGELNLKNWPGIARELMRAKDIVFHPKDIGPFFAQFRSLLYFWQQSQHHGISLEAAASYDISWNGKEV